MTHRPRSVHTSDRAAKLHAGILAMSAASAALPAHAEDHPIKTLMQTYLQTEAPEDFGAIRAAITQGVVDEGLSFCLSRSPEQIVQDLPALKTRLANFASRGEVMTAANGAITDVTFWGGGEEVLAEVHDLPDFKAFMSMTTFLDVQVRTLGDTQWVYCSVTDSSEDAPKTTEKAKAWAERLAVYRADATGQVEDFEGSKHDYSPGQWGNTAWTVRSDGDQRLYAITANEINTKFEYHRILGE